MNVIEPARTSRSRCRQCRREIEEGDLRFGSDYEGVYADGAEAFGWYHLRCAAQRMPAALLESLKKLKKPAEVPDFDKLVASCQLAQKKSDSRYPYGERAPSGRAKCVRCDQPIPKDSLRVAIEREIVTGSFVTVGAGYLHPACATAHLADPDLPQKLRAQSPLLGRAELDALVEACSAEAAPSAAAKPVAPPPKPAAPTPRDDGRSAELVFADTLIEQGDVRGELIVVEQERAAAADGPRRRELEARAAELLGKATARWSEALGVGRGQVALERGMPAQVSIALGKKLPEAVLSSPWVSSLLVTEGTEASLAGLLQDPRFPRIRALALLRVTFGWAGFRGFCACDEISHLESLELHVNLGPRAVLVLLSATKPASLRRLSVGTHYQLDPDVRGFERAAGLPALESLRLGIGFVPEMFAAVTRSPLGQRLKEIGAQWLGPDVLAALSMPALEVFDLGNAVSKQHLDALAKARLPALRRLVVATALLSDAVALHLADEKVLPQLRELDVRTAALSEGTLSALRARFGAGLLASAPVAPKKGATKGAATKTATKKAKTTAKKAATKKGATKKAATKKAAKTTTKKAAKRR